MARPPNVVKLTWTDVKDAINRGDLQLLGRSKEHQSVYDAFCAKTKLEWLSIADFLLASKFDYFIDIDTNTGKKCVKRDVLTSNERFRMAPNDFPYYYEDGIHHYILWKLGGVLTEMEVNDEAAKMRLIHPTYIDHAIYINPPHLKSITEIEHAHILFMDSIVK